MRHGDPDRRTSGSSQGRATVIYQILLLLALWVAVHPYHGIIHDARLYLMQAINDLDYRFADDLLVAYGSQDNFTLFTYIYKEIVAKLGYAFTHVLACFVGQCAWFLAALYLVNGCFTRGDQRILALAGIIALYSFYDGVSIFKYGEPFATPRIYAEALIMLSLGLAQRDRIWLSSVLLLPATALHPLMTLPAIGIVALLAAIRQPLLWLAYAIAFVALLGLAVLGVEPFVRAMMRFDSTWFEIVYRRCWFTFVTRWDWSSIGGLVAHGAVLLMASRVASAHERRLIAPVLVVAAVGTAVTYLGGDLARNVLVVNLQPWRACWIMILLSNAWALIVALRLPKDWLSRDLLFLGLVCQAMVAAAEIRTALGAPLIITAGLVFVWESRNQQPLRGPVRYALWLTAAVPVTVVVMALFLTLRLRSEFIPLWQPIIGLGAVIAAGAALILSIKDKFRLSPSKNLMVIALTLAALAAIDRREDWQKFLDNAEVPISLAGFVGDMRNIYWEDSPALLWFKLERPSYYSCLQGTGVMFYRRTALEYQRRGSEISRLNTLDFDHKKDGWCIFKQDSQRQEPQNREQLVAACRGLPELEAIVLDTEVPLTAHTEWHAPVSRIVMREQVAERINTYYMYRCSALR